MGFWDWQTSPTPGEAPLRVALMASYDCSAISQTSAHLAITRALLPLLSLKSRSAAANHDGQG